MTNLSEDLKRYKQLLGYDPRIGGDSINEKRYHSYAGDTDYAEGDEEETEETETEGFGEEGGEETEGEDNADFDFGGEETEEGGEEEATEEGEEEGDEFGTADEFSAADELESEDDETEEIDVTDIVKRADDAKGYAEKAVAAAEQGKNMIQDLMSKFDALQTSLSKIDTVANELNTIKSDLQAQKPKEKLELRSLDSYPFNVKLTDYWDDEKLKDNYEITSRKPDGKSPDGNTKVWKLNPEEVKDYSSTDIKKSFVPESRSKKKVLTEEQKILVENILWDKIRDKWFDLTFIAKSMGYTLGKIPTLYSLKKKGDEEGYDKIVEDIHGYAEKLYKKHPNHELKSKLQELMYELEKLDDMTYTEFDKDPSKFSPKQQDILMKGMKVTDTGIERDRDIYKIKKEDYSATDIKKSFVPESRSKKKNLIFEDEKHFKQLFVNWANKKSGNPDLALSLMDDFFKLQKKIKRDFISFKSAEEMEETINKIRQSEREKEKLFDAVKIFDNPEVLVIATNTHEASCRYGAGTKWCTAAKDTNENWERHNKTGTEFIWIIKNIKQGNPNYKFSLHLKWDKNKMFPDREFHYDWCNAENNCDRQTPEMLIKYFGKNTFDEIFKKCISYHAKRKEEHIKRLGNYNDLHQKLILQFNENFDEIEADCIGFYNAALENELDYWYGELENELDAKEIKLIFREVDDYMSDQEDETIESIMEEVKNYVNNMDPMGLSEKFLNYGTYDQDKFIKRIIYSIDIFEIAGEIIHPILDQFFREKGF